MLQLLCSLETPSASLRLFSGSLASPNGETGAAQAGNRPAARAVGGTRPKHEGEPESCGFYREVKKKRNKRVRGGGYGAEVPLHMEWEAANESGWIQSSIDQEHPHPHGSRWERRQCVCL